jgi:hypothetical protein
MFYTNTCSLVKSQRNEIKVGSTQNPEASLATPERKKAAPTWRRGR